MFSVYLSEKNPPANTPKDPPITEAHKIHNTEFRMNKTTFKPIV